MLGVETKAYDQGNRTNSSLSPSRTPTEFGLDVSLDSESEPDLTVDLSSCVTDIKKTTAQELVSS